MSGVKGTAGCKDLGSSDSPVLLNVSASVLDDFALSAAVVPESVKTVIKHKRKLEGMGELALPDQFIRKIHKYCLLKEDDQ